MKLIRLLPGIFLLAIAAAALGQIPNKVSYQGLLTGAGDGSYTLKFDVYTASSGGVLRHTETFP
jgi:hypothetical protein